MSMSQSNNEMSSFLAELAGEATQKLEAQRASEQNHLAMIQSVSTSLERTFKFFNVFAQHLNALEPEVPRVYSLDGKTQLSRVKWKSGMAEYRKQSIADNALMNHVYFQVRMTMLDPVTVTRRWEQFEEIKKDLNAFGLKTFDDIQELWKNRAQKVTFQTKLEPEFIIWMRFLGNYADGTVTFESNNLDGFGAMNASLKPDLLQTNILECMGRFLMGRSSALPQELGLAKDPTRVR
jgi:hypothetical protein